MKKRIMYYVMIAGGIGLFMAAFFIHKNIKIEDIVWTSYFCDSNGHINGGAVYLYKNGRAEDIGSIVLCNAAMKENNLLVGVQNQYPDAEGFKGIITYDISTKEVKEILSCDRIYDFLENEKHDFRGNIQMTKDGRFYYFLCGGKMILYDRDKDELKNLFATSGYTCVLNESETHIYFSENGTIYSYNLLDKEKDVLINGVNNFTVSGDGKIIVCEDRKEKQLFMYSSETGEKESLLDLDYIDSQISISPDNRYLLYTDYKDSLVPTNRKIVICVYEFATGKKKVLYRGSYKDNIKDVLWKR